MPSIDQTQNYFASKKPEYVHAALMKSLATGQLVRSDADIITEFLAERKSAGGIGLSRTNKVAFTLIGWRRFLPPFSELTMGSVYTGIETLKHATSRHGRPFKQNTIADHVVILKQFLLWMIENQYINLPEKKIKAIKNPSKDWLTKTAADILTPEEIQKILDACRNSRDRALIMTLYEGGFRAGEVGRLTWGDLKNDSKGIAVNIDFKTGIPRYIRLVMAKRYIAEWRADYPLMITPESPVFLNIYKRPLTWAGMRKQTEEIAKRAGITKHITPHLFRHSRITHLIQEGAKESVIKLMMWGTLNTDMFATYAHLSGRDIDREISRLYGLEEDPNAKEHARLEPRICPACNLINPPGEDYCRGCMEALSEEAIADEESIRRFVISRPRMFRKYLDEVEQNNIHSTVEKI
ncbi:MAG: tyrosine-type recombinase/integrase [Methanolinea sp.]|jgi:integrase|nr:tyrosine-type recombinase/integrase [Methanolinea sp.]